MRSTLFFVLIIVTILSCEEKSASTPDVSDIHVDVTIERYDLALKSADMTDPQSKYHKLLTRFPRMTDLYFKQLVQLYDSDQRVFYENVGQFLSDERITRLIDTVSSIYPELADVEGELEESLRYFQYYFPASGIPTFYAVVTEFGYPTFIFEDQESDAIGIGLDMFLGEDFDYKLVNGQDPAFSDYMTRTYNKDHIAKKSIEMMVVDILGDPPGKRFVDLMIHHGKRLHILDRVMPLVSDTVIMEYTPEQLAWANDNQKQMWDYMLEKGLMYATDHLQITKLLQPAPTTAGMPPQSPGRTGAYMGYKVIEAYMKRHPETTLQDLIGLRDAQRILEDSRYKPRRS